MHRIPSRVAELLLTPSCPERSYSNMLYTFHNSNIITLKLRPLLASRVHTPMLLRRPGDHAQAFLSARIDASSSVPGLYHMSYGFAIVLGILDDVSSFKECPQPKVNLCRVEER